MASFLRSAVGSMTKAGGALKKVVQKTKQVVKSAKEKVRRYRLFAKNQRQEQERATHPWILPSIASRRGSLDDAEARFD